MPNEGQSVGDYRILKVLGQGSQGVAFLAEAISKQKKVVLKRLEQGSRSSTEMRLMQKMRHPNIISCDDSFVHEGLIYLVLTYADGGDLEQYLTKCREAKRSIPLPTAVSWLVQLCSALQYCHDNGIVHRDVKTSNIFLSSSGHVLLGDFGVAKAIDHANPAATMVGSPMSLSPEVISGSVYTPASDVWSLGCILYELLTLQHPFEADNFSQLITRICTGQYNTGIKNSKTPQFLQNVVKGMFVVDPNERWTITDILSSDERFCASSTLALGNAAANVASKRQEASIKSSISLASWLKAKQKDLNVITSVLDKFRAADAELLKQKQVLAALPADRRSPTPEMNANRAKRMLQSPQAAEKVRSQTPPLANKRPFIGDAPSPKADADILAEREHRRQQQQLQLREAMAKGRRAAAHQNKPEESQGSAEPVAQVVVSSSPSAERAGAQQRKKSAPTQRTPVQSDVFAAVPLSKPVPVSRRPDPSAAVIPQTRAVAQNAPPQNPKPIPAREHQQQLPPPAAAPYPVVASPQPVPPTERKHGHERQALKDLIREQRAKQGGVSAGDVNVEIVLPGNLRNLPQNKL